MLSFATMAEQPQEQDAPLLAPPPPHRNSLESHALEREGREKYLRSLETKLNQLEGKDRQLTSKDIVSALSEARDDHLKDHVTPRDSTTSYVNEFADLDEIQTEEKTVGCCGLCARHYPRRRGWGRRKLSDSDRHEYACLIDCDELELSVSSESATSSDRNERRNEHTNYGEQHSHQD